MERVPDTVRKKDDKKKKKKVPRGAVHLIRSALLIGLAHERRSAGTDLRQPIGHPDEDGGGRPGLERTGVGGPQRWRSVRSVRPETEPHPDLNRCLLKVKDFKYIYISPEFFYYC